MLPVPYLFKGVALLEKKQYDAAVTNFNTGIKLVSGNNMLVVQFYTYLGDAYNRKKEYRLSDESYEKALKLAREKKKGESFSQVIKRVLGARGMTASDLLKRIEKVTVSDDTLDRIEEVVRDRERDLVQAPDLSVE